MATQNDDYRLICGLEIHVELKTQSKMFCGCKNAPFFANKPNIYTCDYCLGRETKKPVPNKKAIEFTIKFGLFTGSKIQKYSYFERKHYVYPDVPKGYQISQCTKHFTFDGSIDTSFGPVGLIEAHLEEDVAKMIHKEVDGTKVSLIDFNRSGVPLIEIVSQPDIHSAAQAIEYAKNIQAITRYLGIADADMEKGQMRFDANISLQGKAQQAVGQLPDYKVEIKNINSFKSLGQAIDYEIGRQKKLLESGQDVPQETRGFDTNSGTTVFQRGKGGFADFRAMICPDMSGFEFDGKLLAKWQSELPPKREVMLKDWEQKYAVNHKYGVVFLRDKDTVLWAAEVFAAAYKEKLNVNQLANYLANRRLKLGVGDNIDAVIHEFKEMERLDDFNVEEVTAVIGQIINSNQSAADDYRAGQKQVLGFFIGETLRKIGKKVDVSKIKLLIEDQLVNILEN